MENTNAFFGLIFVVLLGAESLANEKDGAKVNNRNNNAATFFWCARTDNNTHIGYCFEKQKECKEWSRKKFEQNGKKLHLCRPTKL